MSTSAMIFMIISIILVWGGLFLAALHLNKNPDIPLSELEKIDSEKF